MKPCGRWWDESGDGSATEKYEVETCHPNLVHQSFVYTFTHNW